MRRSFLPERHQPACRAKFALPHTLPPCFLCRFSCKQLRRSPLGDRSLRGQFVHRHESALEGKPLMSTTPPTTNLFKGRHFDREIIVLCVRWYLSFKLSARDLVVFKNSISLKMIR